MMSRLGLVRGVVALATCSLFACDDGSEPSSDGGVPADAGSSDCQGQPFLSPLSAEPGYAVVLSDFTSTRIVVLGREGAILDAEWIDSGSTAPGLVAALSGDVVLPSEVPPDGSIAILDRFRTDAVTRICPGSGELVGQVRTHGSEAGFSSNPHDIVWGDRSLAWVTRFEPNPTAATGTLERGSDLRAFDPSEMRLLDRRIGLEELDVEVTIVVDGEERMEPVYARPSRAVRLGRFAVVGLLRRSIDFAAAAPGLVAIVDLDAETFEPLELPGLFSCAGVTAVPERDDAVLVACNGFAQPFGDEPMTRATSGIVQIAIDPAGQPTLERIWRAADGADAPLAANNVRSLGDGVAIGVAYGSFDPPSGDTLYRIDLATGATTSLTTSEGSFQLGSAAFDPSSGRLWVPNAGAGTLEVFERQGNDLILEQTIELPDADVLPPRHVHRL